MPNLTIKNIPAPLYERLKTRAERNQRSLTREVIRCLERSVGSVPADTDLLLERARAVRERARLPYRTADELRKDRDDGRP